MCIRDRYKYIADFYCPTANLVIELDGSQHYEEKGLTYDDERNRFLEEHGIRAVSYTHLIQKQAMDLRKTQRAVAEDILKTYQNTKEEE